MLLAGPCHEEYVIFNPAQVWAVQVESMTPMLTAPGTKRMKLKYDKSAFKFCVQFGFAPLHTGSPDVPGHIPAGSPFR